MLSIMDEETIIILHDMTKSKQFSSEHQDNFLPAAFDIANWTTQSSRTNPCISYPPIIDANQTYYHA